MCGGNPETLLFSELIGFDAKGNPKNEVADSIEANGDNTEYTIKLKKGWKFTDGTEVKAENFTRAWSYGANAKNAQLGASFFAPIQGFEDLQKDGLKGDEQLSGLTVVDDYTFTVKLNAPSSVFKTMLGYSGYAPLRGRVLIPAYSKGFPTKAGRLRRRRAGAGRGPPGSQPLPRSEGGRNLP